MCKYWFAKLTGCRELLVCCMSFEFEERKTIDQSEDPISKSVVRCHDMSHHYRHKNFPNFRSQNVTQFNAMTAVTRCTLYLIFLYEEKNTGGVSRCKKVVNTQSFLGVKNLLTNENVSSCDASSYSRRYFRLETLLKLTPAHTFPPSFLPHLET